ncbi:MAG: branched chain amino acid aminotransferase, partial [Deltaproteobacteria bacterium]|nr:branched chain amino acid aminotransferase [Deltaproteobacteria bacterium]
MEIKVTQAEQSQMKTKPADESQLGFGEIVTDHMYKLDWEIGKGWSNPRIEPYGPIPIDPAAMVL